MKLGLRGRLILAFTLVTVISVVLSLVNHFSQKKTLGVSKELTAVLFPKAQDVLEIRKQTADSYTNLLRMNLQGNAEKDMKGLAERAGKNLAEVERIFDELKTLGAVAGEDELIAKAKDAWPPLRDKIRQAEKIFDSGKPETHAEFSDFYRTGFSAERTAFYQTLDELFAFYATAVNNATLGSESLARKTSWLNLGGTLFGAIVSLGLGLWISNALRRRLGDISAKLAREAETLDGTSDLLNQASRSLHQSINEESSAIQETAASIEEVASMVRKNDENAQNTSKIALESDKNAREGFEVVEEVTRSMDKIRDSNTRIQTQVEHSNRELGEIVQVISEIGNKTKVIHDIVFQTKLLSFNASVEAARAGEHGKGFAVVAEEVGNLAQMSGSAAREITEILDRSLNRVQDIVTRTKSQVEVLVQEGKLEVDSGVETAKRCGDVLKYLREKVAEVKTLVEEISHASREQTQGVDEINKAISQLEKLTHENLASSNSTAKSADDVKAGTRTLRELAIELEETIQGEGPVPAARYASAAPHAAPVAAPSAARAAKPAHAKPVASPSVTDASHGNARELKAVAEKFKDVA